jgi:hypothetical protein
VTGSGKVSATIVIAVGAGGRDGSNCAMAAISAP